MNIVVKTACIRPAQALAIKASPLPNNWHSFLSKNKCSGCRYLLSSFLFYFLKKAQHKKKTEIIPPVWVAFSSSPAEERGWIPLTSPAFAEGSSGAAWQEKVVPCCWQMVPSLGLRNENYFPENIWHCGSLVWNQLGRGQGPQLVSPCNVNFSPLETSQLVFRDGSVPRTLFVMISLLAFVYKLLYNLNVSIQNLKCTGFVQPEVQMKFSLGSWQDLLSHLSNWHSNQRSKNTAKISGAIECLEKPWQKCCFSFSPIIKFIYTSEQTSAWSI